MCVNRDVYYTFLSFLYLQKKKIIIIIDDHVSNVRWHMMIHAIVVDGQKNPILENKFKKRETCVYFEVLKKTTFERLTNLRKS